jgi:hypothetical protein
MNTLYMPIPMHETKYRKLIYISDDDEKISLKSSIYRDISPYNQLKVSQRFGGTCCLHLQVKEYAKEEASMRHVGRRAFRLPKVCYVGKEERITRQLISSHWPAQRTERTNRSARHPTISQETTWPSQMTELFIPSAVITSYPTEYHYAVCV